MRAIWDNEKSDTQVEKMTAEENRGRADNHNGNKGTESKTRHTHQKKRKWKGDKTTLSTSGPEVGKVQSVLK